MYMKPIIPSFLLFWALAAPAATQTVEVKRDKFSGDAWISIDCDTQIKFLSGNVYTFRVQANPGPTPQYLFIATAYLEDWIFINSGPSMVFKVDGEMIPLVSITGSSNSRSLGGYASNKGVTETAIYKITPEQMKKISEGKETEYRIFGSKGQVTESFTSRSKKAFHNLLTMIPKEGGWTLNGNTITPIPKVVNQETPPLGSEGTARTYRAGIQFLPGGRFLQVFKIDPGSPNSPLLNKFILAIDGVRGTGSELQALLNTIIGKHQDGSLIRITISAGPGEPEEESTLKLFPTEAPGPK